MNFKGHLAGGLLTGAGISFIAINFDSQVVRTVFTITPIALIFSMFPDLDTSSIPQRWFYRFIILYMFSLALNNEFKFATLIGILVLAPVIDQHRGWTHSFHAAFIVPLALIIVYQFFLSRNHFFENFNLNGIVDCILKYKWILLAAISGWCSHIILDSKWLVKNHAKHI
ncbi:MAG: hypothetical protein GY714_03105 [Desulfobacterales bacterium]|nr:hypothetical protein [Desulfobacterales bacterium]